MHPRRATTDETIEAVEQYRTSWWEERPDADKHVERAIGLVHSRHTLEQGSKLAFRIPTQQHFAGHAQRAAVHIEIGSNKHLPAEVYHRPTPSSRKASFL